MNGSRSLNDATIQDRGTRIGDRSVFRASSARRRVQHETKRRNNESSLKTEGLKKGLRKAHEPSESKVRAGETKCGISANEGYPLDEENCRLTKMTSIGRDTVEEGDISEQHRGIESESESGYDVARVPQAARARANVLSNNSFGRSTFYDASLPSSLGYHGADEVTTTFFSVLHQTWTGARHG